MKKTKKKKSLSEIRAEAGRAGGAVTSAAKRKAVRANGRESSGRPRNPAIQRIMQQYGVSRQHAYTILRQKKESRESK